MLFLTIGESPRIDLVPELIKIIGAEIVATEIGLLDDVSDYSSVSPLSKDDLLVSRLRNGSQVEVSHSWAEKKLRKISIKEPAILLCTGEFEDSRFFNPSKIIRKFFEALPPINKLAVIVPEKEQTNLSKRWNEVAKEITTFHFSPYQNKGYLPNNTDSFDYIYLDCMGYTLKHEEEISEQTNCIVISARKLVGNFLRCLISQRR